MCNAFQKEIGVSPPLLKICNRKCFAAALRHFLCVFDGIRAVLSRNARFYGRCALGAAIQQLETVGRQLDIPVFQMGQGDPVAIAKAGIEHAKKYGNDLVFLDTAGRLHIDEALMTELQNIKAAVDPAEILLVIDAMIGQDAVKTAKGL